MPDTGFLLLSVVCVMAATAFVLFPHPLAKFSKSLDRTMTVLDDKLVRHRYLVAALLFVTSFLLFKLALIVPDLVV